MRDGLIAKEFLQASVFIYPTVLRDIVYSIILKWSYVFYYMIHFSCYYKTCFYFTEDLKNSRKPDFQRCLHLFNVPMLFDTLMVTHAMFSAALASNRIRPVLLNMVDTHSQVLWRQQRNYFSVEAVHECTCMQTNTRTHCTRCILSVLSVTLIIHLFTSQRGKKKENLLLVYNARLCGNCV